MHRKVIIQTAICVFFVGFPPALTKFYFYQEKLFTFEKARNYCKNEFQKGDLAVIENESSKLSIKQFIEDNSKEFVGERKTKFCIVAYLRFMACELN